MYTLKNIILISKCWFETLRVGKDRNKIAHEGLFVNNNKSEAHKYCDWRADKVTNAGIEEQKYYRSIHVARFIFFNAYVTHKATRSESTHIFSFFYEHWMGCSTNRMSTWAQTTN